VNVIPRYEGDGVNISWRNEQIKEEELKDVFGKISREIKGQEIPEEPKAVVDTTKVVSDGLAIENTNEATSGEFDDEVLP
ncbi:MAG: hypothetical protein Q8Q42_03395, partial [Nanoarchaeota archaeon]|nr:hypothetical protein [Nanoarchaeota archaeon]